MHRTSRFCPILCDLATACSSFLGLGSGSYTTTVSAVCKFKPRPAARMESKKRNLALPGALNSVMATSLWSSAVPPSDPAPLPPLARLRVIPPILEVHLQEVQQFRHRREEQHAVPRRAQLHQQAVQNPQLPARANQTGAVPPVPALLRGVVQRRVVAHLAELHAPVLEGEVPSEVGPRGESDFRVVGVDANRAGGPDPVVHGGLVRAVGAVHGDGDPRGELALDVLDEAPEHERLEDLVQARDDDDLLLLLHPVHPVAAESPGSAAASGFCRRRRTTSGNPWRCRTPAGGEVQEAQGSFRSFCRAFP